MANVKLSQIASGGAFVSATDNIVTVRGGTTDVLTTLPPGATSTGRTAVTSPVTMVNSDGIVNVALTVPGTVTVNGASGRTAWQPYTIKDAAGNATTHNITYTPNSGTIDGAATAVIYTNYSSLTIYSDGTNEFIM